MRTNRMLRIARLAWSVALVALGAAAARAEVKLPAIFSDHMVLQREAAVPVWGWADPGEEVVVSVAGKTKAVKAGQDGKWMAKLDPLPAGGPLTLTVKGKNTLTVRDVLAGEAWLCSGQSNMAMTVGGVENAEQEIAKGDYPQIRMFLVARTPQAQPQAECQGSWIVCSPETVKLFSATAYFFGREIHKTLGVPVGLINSSVGGTPVQAWTSLAAQQAVPELKPILEEKPQEAKAPRKAAATPKAERAKAAARKTAAGRQADPAKAARAAQARRAAAKKAPASAASALNPKSVAVLFNGMIAPLVPYAIRGAIWYQGENNANGAHPDLYALQLATMARDWRTRWGQGDFPFAWVQLPNFKGATGKPENWPILREQMLKALDRIPNSGMAITIDIGDLNNIHPKNKQEVGRRLALWALGSVYGQKVAATSGPLPAGHEIRGGAVAVTFKHADGGLTARGGGLRGFTVAGADKQFKPASARIEGDRVIISSPDVKEPAAARYDWDNNPDGNLANGAGLPASPFRTDAW